MPEISVCCVQFAPVFGDTAANLTRIAELASEAQADLIVYPELCTSGYEFRGHAETLELALDPAGAEFAALKQLSADANTHIVLGFPERAGDKVFNSAALLEPSGRVSIYRKLHLFEREKQRFNPGDTSLAVVDTAIGRLGLMICFDWIFPEVARVLALQGAQIIAHPSNLVLPYCQRAMFARSVENGVFTVTCNRIGSEERDGRKMTFTGASQILSPKGDLLTQDPTDGEALITARLNPSDADDKMITLLNHLHHDRRPEFYTPLTEN